MLCPPLPPITTHPSILQKHLKNSIILFAFSQERQMCYKYLLKLFHVLKDVDLKQAIKNWPDNRAQVGGAGGGAWWGSAKSPSLTFFFFWSLPLPSFSLSMLCWTSGNKAVLGHWMTEGCFHPKTFNFGRFYTFWAKMTISSVIRTLLDGV